ncbi:MAG TPA: acyl-CoA dehydrogenase family protein [Jatrophihabitantaceae bacterium]
MDFDLTPEQTMLAETVRQIAGEHFGPGVARGFADGSRAVAAKGWSTLVDSGLTTLLFPVEAGGAGAGLLDACLVLSELSAALAPVPYLSSAIAAGLLVRALPGEPAEQIAREVPQGHTFGLVLGQDLRLPAQTAGRRCVGWSEGRPGLAVDDRGLSLIDAIGPGTSVDLLDCVGIVAQGAAPTAIRFWGSDDGRRVLAGIRTAVAAGLAGVVDGCATLAWAYIRERRQYGQTIGSFQAVRHMAADLLVDVESCRSIMYGAAWSVDNAEVDSAERLSLIAKGWCGDAAVRSAETAMQLLGGIGVTWESSAHLYLRRARAWSALLGDVSDMVGQLGRQFIAARGAGGSGSS